ncbi:hypothetical protein BJ741DRAFT_636942 [Chytriomyces cf. hyalinus JEL632]|nr:hypothetical protein BJ741DRAFT_636942 [Chytriomyces cf. hyalinus JEL632]
MTQTDEAGWTTHPENETNTAWFAMATKRSHPCGDGPDEELSRQRALIIAMDGTEASLHALDWTCKNILEPARDVLVLLTVGEIDLDVSDVLMNAADTALETLGLKTRTDSRMTAANAKTMDALETAKKYLSIAELRLKAMNRENVCYNLVALASDKIDGTISAFYESKMDVLGEGNTVLVLGSRCSTFLSRSIRGTTDSVLHSAVGGCQIVVKATWHQMDGRILRARVVFVSKQ